MVVPKILSVVSLFLQNPLHNNLFIYRRCFRISCGSEWTRGKRTRRWPCDVRARCRRTTCTWGPGAARCTCTTWRRWTRACTGAWPRRWTGWRASRRPYSKTRTFTRTGCEKRPVWRRSSGAQRPRWPSPERKSL